MITKERFVEYMTDIKGYKHPRRGRDVDVQPRQGEQRVAAGGDKRITSIYELKV